MTTYELIQNMDAIADDACKKSFTELSNNLVDDERQAYNLDRIKYYFTKKHALSSVDAMVVSEGVVCLVEFKSGFGGHEESPSDRTMREMMRKTIRLKACESYIFLEKVICDGNKLDFRKKYMAIIDEYSDSKGVYAEFYKERGLEGKAYSEKAMVIKELEENSLVIYRKMLGGKWIMYDEVQVLYSFEFSRAMDRYFR